MSRRFGSGGVEPGPRIGYCRDGRRCRLYFRVIAGSYNDEKLIISLGQLKKQLHGRQIILIWDGLPSHRSRRMTPYLNQQRPWLPQYGCFISFSITQGFLLGRRSHIMRDSIGAKLIQSFAQSCL